MIVFASFTLQALTIGITYTFGVLFVDLLDAFGAGESTTSWIGSIQPALLYLTGEFLRIRLHFGLHQLHLTSPSPSSPSSLILILIFIIIIP